MTALVALLSAKWAAALGLGWALPAAAAGVSLVATLLCGGDWWLALIVSAGVAGFVALWSALGLKPALAWLAGAAALAIHHLGVRKGAAQQATKERANADRAVQQAERARADADRRNSDPERLRDDDGFRRD
ncbi:hypothetical protein [Xanthobacter tagetidis]|uniref:Uncharacterized protein n=1 Tax=Xanthobacter tagetidis TaxID=60216 RepID=A0A3L7AHF6_9HYPH|nr:hypothetical protein [Xanthobacter tagetidis]MBB6306200.1 membrane protein implicated in regulation of membrane protease activity [Xanthobacter tagetidis]RLP79484.1 hypothetical protein D9R14_07415 [Xanthobacter tagetidis]